MDNILILRNFKSFTLICPDMKEMKSIIELYKLSQTLEIAKRQGNYSLALEMYNKIIKLKLEISNRFGIAKSIAEKANLLENLGLHQKALEEYWQAEKIIQNTNNQEFSKIIFQKIDELNMYLTEKK